MSGSTSALLRRQQYLMPPGIVGAPSFSFVGNTDSGLSSLAAGTVSLVASGVERLRAHDSGISATGNLTVSGYTGSPSFTSGILGSGWRLDASILELDGVYVRDTLRAHIFKKDIVRAVNGYLLISDSAVVAEETTSVSNTIKLNSAGGNATFQSGDLLWYKELESDGNVTGIKLTLTDGGSEEDGVTTYAISVSSGSGTFRAGGTVVRIGSSDAARRGSILLDASSAHAPFIDIVDGVSGWSDWQNSAKTNVRLGRLTGITDSVLGELTGYGLYTRKGVFTDDVTISGPGGRLTIASGSTSIKFWISHASKDSFADDKVGAWIEATETSSLFEIYGGEGNFLRFNSAAEIPFTLASTSFSIKASSASTIALGATSFTEGNGLWMDWNSSTPQFRVGLAGNRRFEWDGIDLVIKNESDVTVFQNTATGAIIGGWTIGASAMSSVKSTGSGGALISFSSDDSSRPILKIGWGDGVNGESDGLNLITMGGRSYLHAANGEIFTATGWENDGGGLSVNVAGENILFVGKRGSASGAAIAGWNFRGTRLWRGATSEDGTRSIVMSSVNSGTGLVYTGSRVLEGHSILWRESGNGGHIVLGQLAATASTLKTGFFGLQMMDLSGLEYFALSADITASDAVAPYNRIAGWAFTHEKLHVGTDIALEASTKRLSINNAEMLLGFNVGGEGKHGLHIDENDYWYGDGSMSMANGNLHWDGNALSGTFAGAIVSNRTFTTLDDVEKGDPLYMVIDGETAKVKKAIQSYGLENVYEESADNWFYDITEYSGSTFTLNSSYVSKHAVRLADNVILVLFYSGLLTTWKAQVIEYDDEGEYVVHPLTYALPTLTSNPDTVSIAHMGENRVGILFWSYSQSEIITLTSGGSYGEAGDITFSSLYVLSTEDTATSSYGYGRLTYVSTESGNVKLMAGISYGQAGTQTHYAVKTLKVTSSNVITTENTTVLLTTGTDPDENMYSQPMIRMGSDVTGDVNRVFVPYYFVDSEASTVYAVKVFNYASAATYTPTVATITQANGAPLLIFFTPYLVLADNRLVCFVGGNFYDIAYNDSTHVATSSNFNLGTNSDNGISITSTAPSFVQISPTAIVVTGTGPGGVPSIYHMSYNTGTNYFTVVRKDDPAWVSNSSTDKNVILRLHKTNGTFLFMIGSNSAPWAYKEAVLTYSSGWTVDKGAPEFIRGSGTSDVCSLGGGIWVVTKVADTGQISFTAVSHDLLTGETRVGTPTSYTAYNNNFVVQRLDANHLVIFCHESSHPYALKGRVVEIDIDTLVVTPIGSGVATITSNSLETVDEHGVDAWAIRSDKHPGHCFLVTVSYTHYFYWNGSTLTAQASVLNGTSMTKSVIGRPALVGLNEDLLVGAAGFSSNGYVWIHEIDYVAKSIVASTLKSLAGFEERFRNASPVSNGSEEFEMMCGDDADGSLKSVMRPCTWDRATATLTVGNPIFEMEFYRNGPRYIDRARGGGYLVGSSPGAIYYVYNSLYGVVAVPISIGTAVNTVFAQEENMSLIVPSSSALSLKMVRVKTGLVNRIGVASEAVEAGGEVIIILNGSEADIYTDLNIGERYYWSNEGLLHTSAGIFAAGVAITSTSLLLSN